MARGRLEIVHATRDGLPVAVIPMVRRRGGLVSAADWHVPMLEAAAVDDEAMDSLAHTVTSGRRRVTIDFCDSAGATATAFRRVFAERGYLARERSRMQSPFVDLSAGRSAYEEGLGARKVRELNRRRRRLAEEGRAAIEVSDGSNGLDEALSEGFAVEGSGWKEAAGTAIRSRRATERFYRRMADWASAAGMLRLAYLRVDRRAIAFDLSIVSAGREWLLKTGYSPAWSRFSPGSLLRSAAIDRAFDDRLEAYEFAGSADPWKLEWTSTCREIVRIDGFAPTLAGRALLFASRAARGVRLVANAGMRFR